MPSEARPFIVSVPDAELGSALGALPAGVEVVEWDLIGPAPRPVIDLVVEPYVVDRSPLRNLDQVRTRLVQSQSNGYDGVADILPSGVVFANARSVHETSTAELALALILASQRGIPDFVRAAERGEWVAGRYPSLADRTVLIVGYGGIGAAIEARLLPFEAEVVRVASRARDDGRGAIHGVDGLPRLLPEADIVVLVVPLTTQTRHLVDADFLAMMRDGSLLVNVSRGAVVDTAALLPEVSAGRIRAALDVTAPEPLPEGHPLFSLPNVLVSPHVGGDSSARLPRVARLVRQQIELLRGDAEPLNVVLRT